MAYSSRGRSRPTDFSIKTIWGLARSKELKLTDDELYAIVYRETGKESIKSLNSTEINKVCFALTKHKDMVTGKKSRTDTRGRNYTSTQRQKIYKLTEELGWNDDDKRINGFCKRMLGVERVEWLDGDQCSKLIEILKKYVARVNKNKLKELSDAN